MLGAEEPSEQATEADTVDEDSQDELDDLLDMDLNQLSNTAVQMESETNPIIEGVSKKEETLAESPGIVDVITAQDIRQFGAKNLYEVLQRATSVYMTGGLLSRRNTASIRGNYIDYTDSSVLVLLNGRPIREINTGGVNASFYTAFPLHMIERVEVIRGPGSVLYGTNAVTGVINVITKKPQKPTGHASTLGGTYQWQSYNLAAGNGDEKKNHYIGATYSRAKGWPFTTTSVGLGGMFPPLTQTAPWGEDNIGVFGSYDYENLTAQVFATRARQEILGSNIYWPSESFEAIRVFADIGYLLELNNLKSLELHFTYNHRASKFRDDLASTPTNTLFSRTLSDNFVIEGTYRAPITEKMDFLIGGLADFQLGRFKSGVAEIVPEFSRIWYGVYFQFEYQPIEKLKLVGGMQANMPGELKSGIVPRAGAILSFNDNWTGKFLYGQAFRSPYAIETLVSVPGFISGNPDLSPETSQTFDVQLAYNCDGFRAAATYFHTDLFGVIELVGFPQEFVNGPRIVYQGFEWENEWRITDRLRWQGSLTYQENERSGVDNTTGVPNWMSKFGLAYESPMGLTVGLFDTYFGDPPVAPGVTILNPDPQPVHLLSLNTTLDVDRYFDSQSGYEARAQFFIQNLLDEEIHHAVIDTTTNNSLPGGPGRTYYGGVTIEY